MMAIVLFVSSLAIAVSAAPSITNDLDRDWQKEFANSLELKRLQEYQRAKRSTYGNLYMSPCAAAAASAPIPAYSPSMTSAASYSSAVQTTGPYAYNQAAYQTVPSHKGASSYYYGHPYYRSEEDLENDQEIMNFSDMNHALNHLSMARNSYGTAQVPQVIGTGGESQPSGQVIGFFPNANVGGCSVPLLVSCSPSIARGWVAKARPSYDGSGLPNQGNMYRFVEDHSHHEEPVQQEKAEPSSENSLNESKSISHMHQ